MNHPNKPGDTLNKTMAGFGLTDEMMPAPPAPSTYPTSDAPAPMIAQWPWPGHRPFPKSAKGASKPAGKPKGQFKGGTHKTMRRVRKAYGHQ